MTPHPAPMLFVATEGGLARYVGEPRESSVPEYRPEDPCADDQREHVDRNAPHGFVAGAFRLLGIGAF